MLSKQIYTTRMIAVKELYELFHISVTYVKRKRDTYLKKKHRAVNATGNQLETSYIQQI